MAGWSAPVLPTQRLRAGAEPRPTPSPSQAEIAAFGALAPAGGPRPAAGGADHRHARHARSRSTGTCATIVTGQKAWCQLFSEPGAGSDLAGLTTRGRARRRRVRRQRPEGVDVGRPDAPTWACSWPAPTPTLPKHQGITWFAFDMHQPGVEVRPLREMTGHAMFNEVFITDARVPADAVIGGLHQRLGGGQHHARPRALRPRGRRRWRPLGGAACPGHGGRPARPRAGDFVARRRPAGTAARRRWPVVGQRPRPSSSWPGPTAGSRSRSCARTSCGSTS